MTDAQKPKRATVVFKYPNDTIVTIEGDEEIVSQLIDHLNGSTVEWSEQSLESEPVPRMPDDFVGFTDKNGKVLSQAENIGNPIIKWMRGWPKKSKGKSMVMRVIVDDLVCQIEVTPIGYWSEIQVKQAAENIKWIMEH